MLFKHKLTGVANHAFETALDLYKACTASINEIDMRIEECVDFNHDPAGIVKVQSNFRALKLVAGEFLNDIEAGRNSVVNVRTWFPHKVQSEQIEYFAIAARDAQLLVGDYARLREAMLSEVNKIKAIIKQGVPNAQ